MKLQHCMFLFVIFLIFWFWSFPSYSQPFSSSGEQLLSSQVSTLRTALYSYQERTLELIRDLLACNSARGFYSPNDPKADAQGCIVYKKCGSDVHSTVRARECAPEELGSIIDQCIDGAWQEKINSCVQGKKTFVVQGTPGPNEGAKKDFMLPRGNIDGKAPHIVGHQSISADTETANALCSMKHFKKVDSIISTKYSSCGNNWMLVYRDGDFTKANACTAGGRYIRSITCSNF